MQFVRRYKLSNQERETIQNQIKEWKQKQFMNAMADYWSSEDYEFDKKCREEIKRLENLLKEEVKE